MATLALRPAPHWGATEILAAWSVLTVGALALAFAVLVIVEILASPFRSFTTLHPLYIVRVQPWKIRLHSLMQLTDIRGVHQHTNGVYTGTSITLAIGDQTARGKFKNVTLRVRGKAMAQNFLDALIAFRGRSLELMLEGARSRAARRLAPGEARQPARPHAALRYQRARRARRASRWESS